MQSTKKRAGNSRGNSGRSPRKIIPRNPPEFQSTISVGHTFRFKATAASSDLSITALSLLNLIVVATTTAASTRVLAAIRLKRIRLWAPVSSSFASQTISIEWEGSQAPSRIRSDTAVYPNSAHIQAKPPAESSSCWWYLNGSNESVSIFRISAPAETILDLDVSLKFIDNEVATAGPASGGTTFTAGTFYYVPMDGNAARNWLPIGGVAILPA